MYIGDYRATMTELTAARDLLRHPERWTRDYAIAAWHRGYDIEAYCLHYRYSHRLGCLV